MKTTRKTFLQAAGAGTAAAAVAGGRAAGAAARAGSPGRRPRPPLSAAQRALLAAWCDALAPGAARARVADFVARQLAKPPADALLMLRYLDWPAPYAPFYAAGLAALEEASRRRLGATYLRLPAARRAELPGLLLADAAGWDGPPFMLFYLATRADAVDVLYGTPAGMVRVGAGYDPLLRPGSDW